MVGARSCDRPFLGPSGVGDDVEFGLLGVPSSAAAHGPGQEKAPAALRQAGLPERLTAAGARVMDYGDLPVVRW